jgi:hypothetical protein
MQYNTVTLDDDYDDDDDDDDDDNHNNSNNVHWACSWKQRNEIILKPIQHN